MRFTTAHHVTDLKHHLSGWTKHVHNNRFTLTKRRAAHLTRRDPFPERNFFQLVYFFSEISIRAFLSVWN